MSPADDGRVIGGRYHLIEPVGRGGMGTVWHARDEVLGRDVAVKEVRLPEGMDPDERRTLYQRTIREARTAARISHPSVVTVYDVVEEDGRPWIVMELVRARPLDKIVKKDGTIAPGRAAQVGRQVLAALAVAHAAGILHRDVKPSNVLIAESGRVVLTDFGIATFEGDASLTQSGMVVGSPGFMPPERAKGERATPASDLWSLGATLYMAVEGEAPYQRETSVATLGALLTEKPPSPVHAGPMRRVIDGLLPREPRRRLTAIQVAQMLDQVILETRTPDPLPAETSGGTRVIGAAATSDSPAPWSTPSGGSWLRGISGRVKKPGRTTLVALAAIVAAIVVIGGVGLALSASSSGDDSPRGGATHTPTHAKGSPSPKKSKKKDTTPAGFRSYHDPTGFRMLLPADWTRKKRKGTSVYFYTPDGNGYVQIDQTSSPGSSALGDWKRAESAWRSGFPGYHRERMENVSYLQSSDAADAQFTWHGSGGRIRVLNRGFVANSDHGYAILWSIPVDRWDATSAIRSTVFDSFKPAGGWG
ncbi:MAG TPA: serine/threonine-protein kinase [Streptosporangiaceae bacterium]|jgi:serine/threonine protein kinase